MLMCMGAGPDADVSAWGPDRAHGWLRRGQDDAHGCECCENLLARRTAVMVVECMKAEFTWCAPRCCTGDCRPQDPGLY